MFDMIDNIEYWQLRLLIRNQRPQQGSYNYLILII